VLYKHQWDRRTTSSLRRTRTTRSPAAPRPASGGRRRLGSELARDQRAGLAVRRGGDAGGPVHPRTNAYGPRHRDLPPSKTRGPGTRSRTGTTRDREHAVRADVHPAHGAGAYDVLYKHQWDSSNNIVSPTDANDAFRAVSGSSAPASHCLESRPLRAIRGRRVVSVLTAQECGSLRVATSRDSRPARRSACSPTGVRLARFPSGGHDSPRIGRLSVGLAWVGLGWLGGWMI